MVEFIGGLSARETIAIATCCSVEPAHFPQVGMALQRGLKGFSSAWKRNYGFPSPPGDVPSGADETAQRLFR